MHDQSLNIIEQFASVQGETSYTGLPTTFIRLAACNLRCTWCDTTYSFGRGTPASIQSLIDQTVQNGCRHVCITGGEPLLQKNVHSLMTSLCDLGFNLSIETGGSLPIQDIDQRVKVILDLKCPGSGMSHKNDWNNIPFLKSGDEVKFVLMHREDYDWALDVCKKHQLFDQNYEILLSPVHNQLDSQTLVKWIVEDKLPVRLNLQIHKFIWTPETKGV